MNEVNKVLQESYEELKTILIGRVLPAMSVKHGTSSVFFLSTQQMEPEDLLNDAIVKFLTSVDPDAKYDDTKKFVVSSVMNICKQLLMNKVKQAKQRFKNQEDVKQAYQLNFVSSSDLIDELEFEDAISQLDPVDRTIVRNIDEPNSKFKKAYGVHYRNVKAQFNKTAKELERVGFEV